MAGDHQHHAKTFEASQQRAAASLESLAEHGAPGAAALEHDVTLVTRDRRALNTDRELGVSVERLS